MWFDSWPGISHLPVLNRPLLLTYGDDSPLSQKDRQEYVDVHDKYGFPIEWNKGDISIICNFRFLHGRPAYDVHDGENRELGVMIGNTFDRIGHKDKKW
jgi:hypothetical protein